MPDERSKSEQSPHYVIRAVNDFTSAHHSLSISYVALWDDDVIGTAYLYGNETEAQFGLKVRTQQQEPHIEADLLNAVLAYVEQHRIERIRTAIATGDSKMLELLQSAGFKRASTPPAQPEHLVLLLELPTTGRDENDPDEANHPE